MSTEYERVLRAAKKRMRDPEWLAQTRATAPRLLPRNSEGHSLANPAVLVWVKTETTCVQCDATRRALNKAGIPFIERALEDHPEQVEDFKKRGLLQAPIVETSIGTWSGFRPDLIKQLAKEQA